MTNRAIDIVILKVSEVTARLVWPLSLIIKNKPEAREISMASSKSIITILKSKDAVIVNLGAYLNCAEYTLPLYKRA